MRTTTKTGLLKSLHTAWMGLHHSGRSRKRRDVQTALHRYDNHSDIPSWGGGYGNIFQVSVT